MAGPKIGKNSANNTSFDFSKVVLIGQLNTEYAADENITKCTNSDTR